MVDYAWDVDGVLRWEISRHHTDIPDDDNYDNYDNYDDYDDHGDNEMLTACSDDDDNWDDDVLQWEISLATILTSLIMIMMMITRWW